MTHKNGLSYYLAVSIYKQMRSRPWVAGPLERGTPASDGVECWHSEDHTICTTNTGARPLLETLASLAGTRAEASHSPHCACVSCVHDHGIRVHNSHFHSARWKHCYHVRHYNDSLLKHDIRSIYSFCNAGGRGMCIRHKQSEQDRPRFHWPA